MGCRWSLEFVYYFIEELVHTFSVFAADLHINAVFLMCDLAEICIDFLIIRFIADYVDRTCSSVLLDLSKPVLYAFQALLGR